MRKLPRSNCLYCQKPCKRATTVYCSCKCRSAHMAEQGIHFGGPKSNALPRTCPHCEKVFLPNNYKLNQKYCSKKCSSLDHIDLYRALGKLKKGTVFSLESRRRMSIAASNRSASLNFTKGLGGIREDLGHYVRSSWEANIARILNYEHIHYEYEPDAFVLIYQSKELRYRPDFKVKDHYIEVKGWWNTKSILIKDLMQEQHPAVRIEYIAEPEYKLLSTFYQEHIHEWEQSRRVKSG